MSRLYTYKKRAVKDVWGQIYSQNSHGWINLEDIKITWIYK